MRNKAKTILGISILMIFLMPLMGNTVCAYQLEHYFDNYDTREAWEGYPGRMIDGNENTYAYTTINGDVQLLNESTYEPTHPDGTITRVEIRAKGCASSTGQKLYLRPVFGGTTDGLNYTFNLPLCPFPAWSQWFDITNDPSAPSPWDWEDVNDLDCDVEAVLSPSGTPTVYCSKVELRITYVV